MSADTSVGTLCRNMIRWGGRTMDVASQGLLPKRFFLIRKMRAVN